HLMALASRFPVDRAETTAEKTRATVTKLLETLIFILRQKVKDETILRSGSAFTLTLCRMIEQVNETIRSIGGNANPQLAVEILCIRMRKMSS
ncbi:MAG: hypothetical protein AB1546_13840, partial [bacterium]